MLTTLPLVLSGVDVVQGMGAIDNSNTVVLEQIVVDHEIARQCRRIRRGVEVCEEKSSFSDIAEIGPGGNFLGTDTTVAACRSKEFYESDFIDWSSYEMWNANGRPDIYSKARDVVENILASPQKNPLPHNVLESFDEIIRKIENSGVDKK